MEPYNKNRFDLFYTRPHYRYMTWLIGVSFGYFVHKKGNKPVELSRLAITLGWLFALGTFFLTLYYPWTQIGEKSIFNAACYDSFHKIFWALSICVVIFLCDNDYGGIINSFLSHPLWKPLSRLSYTMYVLSFAVSKWNTASTRKDATLDVKEAVSFCL